LLKLIAGLLEPVVLKDMSLKAEPLIEQSDLREQLRKDLRNARKYQIERSPTIIIFQSIPYPLNAWSNIEVSGDDPEINRIGRLEKALCQLPGKVVAIRELITRFELCHFKYRQHIHIIKESISLLRPLTDPHKIGAVHISHGEKAVKKDITGRSRTGWRYVMALRNWLNDGSQVNDDAQLIDSSLEGEEIMDKGFIHDIMKKLGNRNPEKERLVRLLISRMTWDWEPYERLKHEGENRELELQCCRIDTCHYAFPGNLDRLLEGIAELKPVRAFEGCGSSDPGIRTSLRKEFSFLETTLKSILCEDQPDQQALTRAWLYACLLKTIKEQAGLNLQITL
jgi:hypothetical protein